MDSDGNDLGAQIDDWLSDPAAFELYERSVREKLEESCAATIARLGEYTERVERLRLGARSLGVALLEHELEAVSRALSERVAALRGDLHRGESPNATTEDAVEETALAEAAGVEPAPAADDSAIVLKEILEEIAQDAAPPDSMKRSVADELDELRVEATRLAALLEQEKDHEFAPDGNTDSAARFRLKALLCSVRSARATYCDCGAEPLPSLLDTLDGVHFLLGVNGGVDASPACDDKLVLHPLEWTAFATAYASLAEAQFAYQELNQALSDRALLDEEKALLRSIAAKQQLFYWLADQHGRTDPDQQKLFHSVKQLGEAHDFYLPELNPKSSDKNLDRESKELAVRLERLRTERAKRSEAAQKDIAKQRLVEMAGQLSSSPDPDPSLIEQFTAAVAEALRLKVPPTTRELKSIFQLHGHLLPDEKPFGPCRRLAKLPEAAIEATGEPEEEPEPDFSEDELHRMLEALRPLTKNQKFLVLGGHPGDGEKRDKLVEALELKALEWPETSKNASGRRFEGKIKQADRLLLDTRMIGHKVSDPAIPIAARNQTQVTLLPKGSGFQQIVRALHEQLVEKPRKR